MDWSPVDPSSLMGNDLTRWYLRSPDEIEQQRQAAQAQRYEEFFGRIAPARPPAALPGLTDQDADVATDDGANRGATSWQRPDQSPDGPWAETQASANERQAYCRNHDGEVGWPLLQTR